MVDCEHVDLESSVLSSSESIGDLDEDLEELNESELDAQLYCGCDISTAEFMIALKTIRYSHKLNAETIKDILQLFRIFLPRPNKCPTDLSPFSRLMNTSY